MKKAVILTEEYYSDRFPMPQKFEAGTPIFGPVQVAEVKSVAKTESWFNCDCDLGGEIKPMKCMCDNVKVGDIVIVDTRRKRVCTEDDVVRAFQAHAGTYGSEDTLKGIKGISY